MILLNNTHSCLDTLICVDLSLYGFICITLGIGNSHCMIILEKEQILFLLMNMDIIGKDCFITCVQLTTWITDLCYCVPLLRRISECLISDITMHTTPKIVLSMKAPLKLIHVLSGPSLEGRKTRHNHHNGNEQLSWTSQSLSNLRGLF